MLKIIPGVLGGVRCIPPLGWGLNIGAARFRCTVFMVFVCLVGFVGAGTTYYVSDGGSIQAAINGAVSGDTVIVSEGTYSGNIDMGGKGITLRSTDPTDFSTVAHTTIRGDGAGSVIVCASGEGSGTVIDGFTITNGNAVGADGGGMYNSGSSPTVNNCVFIENRAFKQFTIKW